MHDNNRSIHGTVRNIHITHIVQKYTDICLDLEYKLRNQLSLFLSGEIVATIKQQTNGYDQEMQQPQITDQRHVYLEEKTQYFRKTDMQIIYDILNKAKQPTLSLPWEMTAKLHNETTQKTFYQN